MWACAAQGCACGGALAATCELVAVIAGSEDAAGKVTTAVLARIAHIRAMRMRKVDMALSFSIHFDKQPCGVNPLGPRPLVLAHIWIAEQLD